MLEKMLAQLDADTRGQLLEQSRGMVRTAAAGLQRGDEMSPELRGQVTAIQALSGLPKEFAELSPQAAWRVLLEVVRDDTMRRVS